MFKTGYLTILAMFAVSCLTPLFASNPHEGAAQRDFWTPTYHVERLNYCLLDGKTCGIDVANRYCNLMGYQRAVRAVIEYNVGFTHYLASNAACKGWRCHGFKLIQCENKITHKPAASYYYRYKKFPVPRYSHYRVDWCLEKQKHCGKPVANSFCQRLGYTRSASYEKEQSIPATKTLGSQALCFGKHCSGFKKITCYR